MRRLAAALAAAALLAAAPAPAHAASLTTVAGTGLAADAGDGGPATSASLNAPYGIAAMPGGGYVVSEYKGHRIRRIASDGTISTLAGNVQGFGGDGGPATAASLSIPFGVAAQADGGVLIADFGNQRIRRVAPDGTISTVAGNGNAGYAGDGGPATEAALAWPNAVAALPGGGFLISDWLNQRIRRVDADGRISTVAGTGTAGFAGDGGPATLALLNSPLGVAAMPDGGFLITDHDNDRIRRVAPDGTISTHAGSGVRGFAGDGGPATAAALHRPTAAVADPDGGVFVADRTNQRIRRVAPDGTIATVAGSGVPAWLDAADATQGQLREPSGVTALGGGVALIADTDNNRVRRLEPAGPGSPPPPGTAAGVVDLAARTGPLGAQGGRLVWSRFDPATRRFALVTRDGTAVRRLPVKTRKVPFDVDLGRGPGGRPWAVYSRCRREPVTSAGRMGLPVWASGRGCDLYAFDLARERERRLRLPGSARASEFLPSVAGGRIAYGRVSGRRGRPEVVVRRLDGRGAVVRWTRPRGRQAGPTGLDLAKRALAIGWATSTRGGRAATQVWLRAGGRARRLDDASAGSGRWLTAPVLDGSWLVWGQSCASGTACGSPRLRRAAVRGGRRGTATPPALALAAIAFDRGHGFGLVGAGAQAAGGCGSASTGASCRVLDLGRPFR